MRWNKLLSLTLSCERPTTRYDKVACDPDVPNERVPIGGEAQNEVYRLGSRLRVSNSSPIGRSVRSSYP